MNKKLLFLFLFLVLAAKILITSFWVPAYYDTNEDYITHSLAHGIHMDIRLRTNEPRVVDFLRYLHPGFPFQISGWLLYRGLNWSYSPIDSAMRTLQDPETFWKLNQYYAFILNVGFIFLCIKLFEIKKFIDFLIFFFVFFAFETMFTFSFFHLGNETFAIPIFIAIAYLLNRSFTKQSLGLFFLSGAFIGLSYLNKLNYIGWFFAIVSTLFLYLINPGKVFLKKSRLVHSFVLFVGLVFFVLFVSWLMIGRSGTRDMFVSHLAVFRNSGPYGQGSAGILSLNVYKANIFNFFKTQVFYVIVVMPLFILQLRKLYFDFKDHKRINYYSIYLVSAFLFIFLIVMKQYSNHYFIPAAVVMPFVYLNLREELSLKFKKVLLGFLVLLVGFNVYNILTGKSNIYHQDSMTGPVYIQSYNNELDVIRSLPLPKGEKRMWYYRIKSKEYCSRMVINWSSNFWLHGVYDKYFPQDMIDLEVNDKNLPYYLIFQKNYDNLSKELKLKYSVSLDGSHLTVYKRR